MGLKKTLEEFIEGYRMLQDWAAFVEDAERLGYGSADFERDIRNREEQRFPELTERYIALLKRGRNRYTAPVLAASAAYALRHPRQTKRVNHYLSGHFSGQTIRELSDELFQEGRQKAHQRESS